MNCDFCGCQVFSGDRCCPRCGAPMLRVPSMMEYSPRRHMNLSSTGFDEFVGGSSDAYGGTGILRPVFRTYEEVFDTDEEDL